MRVARLLAWFLSFQLSLPPLCIAQTVTSSSLSPVATAYSTANAQSTASKGGVVPINLDLTSTQRTLTPGHLVDLTPLNIRVGGVTRTITSSSLLTPAERLATYQVFSTGQQSIQLAA